MAAPWPDPATLCPARLRYADPQNRGLFLSYPPVRPLETLNEDWSQFEFQSDLPASETFHRSVSSLPPDTGDLPALHEEGLVELEQLGEGGMGVVHAARDGVLGRVVATKRARPEAGPRAVAALMAEARTLASLDHPNIVPVHALAKDASGAPVLVMKRVVGRRWSQVVHDGPDLDRDLGLALQVTSALRFAHARGLLHRDIKLDNVMVGDFGEVYLMDWGCATALGPDAVTTEIVGTPTHMAPEMVQIGAPLRPHTDVYLLGATLHHALTGRPRHEAGRVRDVLDHAWRSAPATWSEQVPFEVAALIDRACARDPADRYATAEAFAQALRDTVDHRQSLRLAHTAQASLTRLVAAIAAQDPRVDVLFAECRVGFRAALDAWAGCPEAVDGLEAAFAAWVPWKLAQGDAAAVEALLPELPSAARWAPEVAAARERQARVQSEWREQSLEFAASDRSTFASGLLALCLGMFLVVESRYAAAPMTSTEVAMMGWVAVILPSLAAWLFRARLATHRMSRSVATMIIGMGMVSELHRVSAWYAGAPADQILLADCFVFGGCCAMAGLLLERVLIWVAVPYLVAGVLISLFPGHGDVLYPIAAMLSLTAVVWVFRRKAQLARG